MNFLLLDPKLGRAARKARRAQQADAALALRDATRERQRCEDSLARHDGLAASRPKAGPRGTRETMPGVIVAAAELVEAEAVEEQARRDFRESLKR